ncbi:MAG: hypothetical protein ACOYD4_11705 [Solirubrobacterales bacterium]
MPVIVTKPSVLGWGMNWQHCHNQVFVGLSYSWEEWYQAIRRCYRFGQKHEVNIHVVLTRPEQEVFDTIMQKESVATAMAEQLINHVRKYEVAELADFEDSAVYVGNLPFKLPKWMKSTCERMEKHEHQ